MTQDTKKANLVSIKAGYVLALLVILHSLFFLVYLFAVGLFRQSVDEFLSGLIGVTLPYVTLVMVLVALIFLATALRFWGLRKAVNSGQWRRLVPDVIFFAVWLLFLLGFYAAFYVIFQQDPSQRGVVRHLLSLTRLGGDALLFLVAAVWLRRLVLFLRGKQQVADTRWPWTVGITLTLVALVGLWLVPALFPPSWAYQGDLPTKPALIAHRGASMLAPENTLGALDLAAVNGALGFETDLRISLDGVPFLMHDDTLARTTNIAEIFPERVDERASSFMLEELKTLNAGLWFIQKDPFGTIRRGVVSQTQLSINQGQAIPTLVEALERVGEHNMVIMFDMRYPPADHPYYEEYFAIVLEQSLEARLNSDLWFLLSQNQLPIVLERAPGVTRVAGASSSALPAPEALQDFGYEIINVDTGIPTVNIRAYRAEGLGVNVYTIDEPWLFSQFWLAGVTSVTTNNIHTLSQLDRPLLNVPYARYVLFWGLFGIILAIWLASSQPEPEPLRPEETEPPSLLDFDFGPDVTIIQDAGWHEGGTPADESALASASEGEPEADEPEETEMQD
ncbi:MAG: glycerophosphodiester phosphodiesterase family protein [Brevefilum sp.]